MGQAGKKTLSFFFFFFFFFACSNMQIGTVWQTDARHEQKKKKGILRESGHLQRGYFFTLRKFFARSWHQGPPPPREVPEWVPLGITPKEERPPEKSRANGDVPRRNVCRRVEHLARDPATSIIVLQLSSIWRHVENLGLALVFVTADIRHLVLGGGRENQSIRKHEKR
ncbi:hypothetical protein BDP81DRAFT_221775 [Colletotrichum phormii]|uniref:Secreted protein n=1 Tax=Colletotrichum phormii TaxID=359342 RepID=A0AAJ0EEP6_9PEZI|nr:uncharacterized protein BDP81DRAFT_221775 [Colletotrichum phormii]KAK1637282.1 hypothetical protein BDP81DRAFT_221775 [Colletotrichum phormii]